MNKDDEQILVVPSDIIFAKGKWHGLKTDDSDYYLELIENNCQFKRRGDVENDPSFQQIIPYMLFSYEGRFFAYKYIKNAGETRLINDDYQLGVGGHINKEDIKAGGNVLREGMEREWDEEVDYFGEFIEKKFVGIVNDESRPVEQVHLGLVYHFVGTSPKISVRETDKMEGGLFDLKEIESNISHSPWMQIVFDQYLKKPDPNQKSLFSGPQQKIKNVIFDWSGVIKDWGEDHVWVVNQMFKNLGRKDDMTLEEMQKNWEQPYMKFWNKYFPEMTLEEEQKVYYEVISRHDLPEARAYAGMVDLIKKMKNAGIKMAVLSSDPPETLLKEVEKFGLENIFCEIVNKIHDKNDGIHGLMERNNFRNEETAFVGDTNHEIEVGKEAGIKTIAVTWGFYPEKRLKDLKPDYLVHSIEELERILLKDKNIAESRYPGKFIVVEGLDGSGKSAQVDLLVDYLKSKGKKVIVTKEPTTESEAGRKVKQALKKEIYVEPLELQKLYVQDRKEHLQNKVMPALKEGKFVISSRYFFSTLAYGYSDGLDINLLKEMNRSFLLPDLTIIVDVMPESCVKRIDSRGEQKELFEQLEKLQKVNEIYKKLPEMFGNIFVISGEKPIPEVFAEVTKIINNKFFNMAERKIYTLPNNLMPEVKAVTFAKCSRSPECFDKIAAELTEEKSAEFHDKWVVGFGHSSIAEHAVISLAVENVSNIATKAIEDSRLASFTEKSSRYQIFSKEKLYMPESIMNSELKDIYLDAVNSLMDAYEEMTPAMMDFVKQKYPRSADKPEKLYEMVSKARACDNLRYLLPSAVLTNLGMTINTRELEHLIVKLLSHPLKEMQDIGEEMKEKAMEAVPTLVKFANKNDYIVGTKKQLKTIADWELGSQAGNNQAVTIVNYDKDAEDKLIAAILYPYTNLSYEEIFKKVKILSQEKKEKIIEETLKRRQQFDQPLRELEHIYYTFDILLDFGAFRDVQRHRMCTQSNQPVTVVHGYDLPPEIREAGFEDKFRLVVEKSVEAYKKIAEKFGVEEAQYVVPMCFRKRVLITWNLRELHHFISLRSGKKGHQSYRRIAQQCWRELNKIQPLLAKYIRCDFDEMSVSWAASLENKDFYYNPFAARQK